MPFIVLQVGGEQALVTYQEFVNDRNAGNPVSVFYFSLSLNVILTSGKVPHKVSPIHEVHLIREKELDVLPLGRNLYHHHLSALVVRHLCTFHAAQPVFVGLPVTGCIAVHTREQHILCILIFCFMANHFVAVFFVGSSFFFPLIYRSSFCHIIHASAVHFLQCRF